MKTCKNCMGYFYDWCPSSHQYDDSEIKEYTDGDIRNLCDYFKDYKNFIELPCAIGDITYCIVRTGITKIIQAKVTMIEIQPTYYRIWIQNIEDESDVWFITENQYNKWAKFSTREEAEKKLEELNETWRCAIQSKNISRQSCYPTNRRRFAGYGSGINR